MWIHTSQITDYVADEFEAPWPASATSRTIAAISRAFPPAPTIAIRIGAISRKYYHPAQFSDATQTCREFREICSPRERLAQLWSPRQGPPGPKTHGAMC